MDAREAIEAILESGGIPVWAHPYGGYVKRDMDDEEFNNQLHILLDAGLQRLKCYYSAFDQEQVEKLLATAQKHNLIISGGSDYHGDRKNIQLGTLNAYGKIVNVQNHLRELCAAVVDESLSIMNYEGTPFELK